MHLKTLTLKGFKSFASPTTLRFEQGITCVVGPNGSGKSNVVDAIAWVLGEQGAKALRGGKMEDVIFAGAPGRPPLGRAEVTLTIDNSDGALPIDYTEVSIRRLMFAGGASEYSLNGATCRLVDVQELMSDSGIGRELHVVVGQGQLDAVLAARPEDRRGFIEEAAGVLKHRKRKERALRKLESTGANLHRLTDLTAELRRQLKPLGRQAEVARRAAQVQADLRDARLRLLADELLQQRCALDAEIADETAVRARRADVERELAAAQAREGELEAAASAQAPALARAQETWYRLSALEERLRGTATLAAERHRHLTGELPEQLATGRDPEQLELEAAGVREQEAQLAGQLAADGESLRDAVTRRTDAEAALAAEEKALVAAVRAIADRREGLARLTGQVGALRSRAGAAEAELGRLATALAEAHARAARAQADLEQAQAEAGGLDAGELDLDDRHGAAAAALEQAQRRLAAAQTGEREAERERGTWAARRDALALSLTREGSGALLTAGLPGVLGTVATLVRVEAGFEAALAAALGAVADAVAVASPGDAAAALARLKADDAGRAGLLVGGAGYRDEPPWPALPDGAHWAIDLVAAPPALRPPLARALRQVAVVTSLQDATELLAQQPDVRAVTVEGDLLGADWAVGGSASAPSLLEVQAAVDEATAAHDDAQRRQERLRFEVQSARTEVEHATGAEQAALAALHRSDAAMAAFAERLGLLASVARAAAAEAGRLEQSRVRAEQAHNGDLSGLAELEQRLAAAQAAGGPETAGEPSTDLRDRLLAETTTARAAEVEARLAVRTGEERARALAGRAEALERGAREQRAARERLVALRSERSRGAAVAEQVARGAREALHRIAVSLAAAAAERDGAAAARTVTDGELLALRTRLRTVSADLDRLTDVVHREEVARAEQRLRIEALQERAVAEWGVPVDRLLEEYGPQVPVPVTSETGEVDAEAEPTAYDREAQEKRAATAERALALLGRVNPLALEEFAALEERSAFLTTQLEDLQQTRRDLLAIVRDVDARIHEVFSVAFEDTAREFVQVFATLFPGGEGSLVLTEPDDLLATGIEVLARPAGKKISRLSLLSGGERSLTALAFLVALFRARPSPFYVLDEVEAALDDRNLTRLLALLEGLREASQLIVITHQKRMMEIADALYGVTMRGDGVSAVVSQRLREPESA
ncbi:MAG: chromosome segregation protein SMC [Actinobacteria bacterium]|nr:chromosome segregation protein SMC [Actinomycetota bacterium]